ncbi:hypothetical protein ACFE04_012881 [Oxalis oulophora]
MDGDHQIFQHFINNDREITHNNGANDDDDFLLDDSTDSESLLSSDDLLDDASSNGPLYQLSEALMTHLPIKRGLSKYYQGKSQSFTSLESVKSIEDLAKKAMVTTTSRRKNKMKSCNNKLFSPNNRSMMISKKDHTTSFLISSLARYHRLHNHNNVNDKRS